MLYKLVRLWLLVLQSEQSTIDNGLVDKWKITVLPALFAVNPHTQEVIPLAQGLSSLAEIENRIMTLIGANT